MTIPMVGRGRARGQVLAVACAGLGILACDPSQRDAAKGVSAPSSTPDTPAASNVPDSLLITALGVGRFRLGMTLEEARRAHPTATFMRVSDGDGAALVEATLGSGEALILFAGETDPEAPIGWSRPIATIEAFCPAFVTFEGIHPGSPIVDVERTWGTVREIVRSEIESREFVTFARQPAGLRFRLDYTGRFPADSRITTEFEPGAAIYSISISNSKPDPGTETLGPPVEDSMLRSAISTVLLRELGAVRRSIEAYPDDASLWAERPGLPNAGGTLALHVAGNLRHFVGLRLGQIAYVRDRDAEFARRNATRADIVAEIDAAREAVERALAATSDAVFEAEYPEPVAGRRVSTAGFLVHLAAHLAYHLGQLDYHRRIATGNAQGVGAIASAEVPAWVETVR